MNAKRYRCGILANCCVPWDEDCGFAEEVFRRQVRRLIAHGIRDLYIFGTAGEGYAVTDRQFDEITRAFLDETRGDGVRRDGRRHQPVAGYRDRADPTGEGTRGAAFST